MCAHYKIEQTERTIQLGPGHFPCNPLVGGVNEQIFSHLGWINVIPAATGTVDFTINGKRLQFTGTAYHDHVSGRFVLHEQPEACTDNA